MKLSEKIALASWFFGGFLLGLIEVIALPSDPNYSTALQLLPLFFLVGGLWFIVSQSQKLWSIRDGTSHSMRNVMLGAWIAFFGVDAGIASVNNIVADVFQQQLPYYYKGISLAQKIIALAGIFVLGMISGLTSQRQQPPMKPAAPHSANPWEKPLTNIGLITLLLGIVLGLAQFWSAIVFSGFLLLLAGVFLYPIGKLTEKEHPMSDEEKN